ncbi:hypothetical protein WMF18_00940 [Sorangium sp. So ce315]|uniref:hypothetical protein n=1 Tax=Sorangium sp. So ce315 TaxID=3133299 RepID=UPI003F60E8EF
MSSWELPGPGRSVPAMRLRMSAIGFEQSVTREMRPAASSTSRTWTYFYAGWKPM